MMPVYTEKIHMYALFLLPIRTPYIQHIRVYPFKKLNFDKRIIYERSKGTSVCYLTSFNYII